MKIKNLLVEDSFIEEILSDLNKQEDSYVLIDYDICKELHTKTGIYRLFLMDYARCPILTGGDSLILNMFTTQARIDKAKEKLSRHLMYEELFEAPKSSMLPFLMPADKLFSTTLKEETDKVIMPEATVLLFKGQIFRSNDLVIKIPKEYKKGKKENSGHKVLKKNDYKRSSKHNSKGYGNNGFLL